MQSALRVTTFVQPGGKIEVTDTQLLAGQSVEVIVLLSSPSTLPRRSIMEVLAEAPGHLAFQTADEVDTSDRVMPELETHCYRSTAYVISATTRRPRKDVLSETPRKLTSQQDTVPSRIP